MAIVTAMPMPTYAATMAPRSTNRLIERWRRCRTDTTASAASARVVRVGAELLLDPEKPVVLRDALGA